MSKCEVILLEAKKKICEYCGQEYETTAGNSKFCGVICAAAEAKRRRQQWTIDNPDYYREYRKAHRQRAEDLRAVTRQTR
jgi:hypothetical protein